MLLVGLLESAIGALDRPNLRPGFISNAGQRTATLFGLEQLIPRPRSARGG